MNVVLAELSKLRTLPLTGFTVAGILACTALLAAADQAVDIIMYVQAGFVLLGIIPVAHEHAGRQFGTTLIAVPARGRLLVAKSLATAVVMALTAAATAVLGGAERPVGAAAYLVFIGLFAYAVAVVVRQLIPALVGMLSLILIVSPVLADHGRWLPDRAAAELYQGSATIGALGALAWVALIGAVATVQFLRRDL
ncbi:ABC transporter permease [Kribbella antibiotica]|uniref:ABC transporter permease n=1 Tax=Kribbella antibiotica TaxID=190195 RepID=A0A4R4ZVD6_9ACTN|nr:ABC transporter permease [Kribbella antibiotica]TDD62164.1 ABC transporter permease [Kribbella antibiotica]